MPERMELQSRCPHGSPRRQALRCLVTHTAAVEAAPASEVAPAPRRLERGVLPAQWAAGPKLASSPPLTHPEVIASQHRQIIILRTPQGCTVEIIRPAVLARIDRLAGSRHSRSGFIARVLRRYLLERERDAVQARDLERINHAADRLNSEAADVMEYQASV